MRREWIEIITSKRYVSVAQSPSMRREWIEIYKKTERNERTWVSLHAEGVD